jgi:alpha-acetolactate decarboxylase
MMPRAKKATSTKEKITNGVKSTFSQENLTQAGRIVGKFIKYSARTVVALSLGAAVVAVSADTVQDSKSVKRLFGKKKSK